MNALDPVPAKTNARKAMTRLSEALSTSIFVAACLMPIAASAANCAGTNVNNLLSWDQTEIAKGTTLSVMRSTSVSMTDDASSKVHMVSGECIGSFLNAGEGRVQGSGHCARRDKDGDVLFEEWIATDGAGAKGTWKHTGGTGKFTRAAGSGQWAFSPLQGKMSAVRWTGNCD